MFIVIEGGDASGKTTLINGLKQNVQNGHVGLAPQNTIFLKSPTPPFDTIWRNVIKTTTPLTRFYLFRAIAQNDVETAKTLIRDGKNVILERYFLSTEAFNWALDEENKITNPEIRSENHVNYSGLLKPDLGFFLDVSDQTRDQRLMDRQYPLSNWENHDFQTVFNQKLRFLAKRNGWIFVDTDKMDSNAALQFVISNINQYHR